MNNQQHKEPPRVTDERPLVFHLRALRQWQPEGHISQAKLGRLVGLTARQIRRYETMRTVPTLLRRLLLIAQVLGQPLEALLAPDVLSEIQDEVARRRATESDPETGRESTDDH